VIVANDHQGQYGDWGTYDAKKIEPAVPENLRGSGVPLVLDELPE
jgi:hypothetical protein